MYNYFLQITFKQEKVSRPVIQLIKYCILPKGEELNKFNAEALKDWNDTALLPCDNCGR
jgi:hypothetical protein